MELDLPFIWAGLIAFAVLAYVVLDGFDLGVGILFPFFPEKHDRDVMTNSIAPVWDGNETWLVLGGGGLMAVFPLAYATVLPALYMPIILMLLGLIFRGVAFEFRWRTKRWQRLWDNGFMVGSIVAAAMQGIALGALVQGIHIEGREYAGGWWDWLTPFSILTGIAVVVGYALLGACWLNLKTTGKLQDSARRLALIAGVGTLATDRRRQPLDAVPRAALLPALVRLADRDLLGDRARAARDLRLPPLPGPDDRKAPPALPRRPRLLRPELRRPRHQLLSLHRPRRPDLRAGRRAR